MHQVIHFDLIAYDLSQNGLKYFVLCYHIIPQYNLIHAVSHVRTHVTNQKCKKSYPELIFTYKPTITPAFHFASEQRHVTLKPVF